MTSASSDRRRSPVVDDIPPVDLGNREPCVGRVLMGDSQNVSARHNVGRPFSPLEVQDPERAARLGHRNLFSTGCGVEDSE